MICLKAHNKKVSNYSDIDRLILIPKKFWEDFSPGSNDLRLNGEQQKLRVYDIPCDCTGQMHSHRIVDLRNCWDKMKLVEGTQLEIEK